MSCGIRIGGLLLRFGIEGGLGGGGGGRVAFLRWSPALVLDGINERLHELVSFIVYTSTPSSERGIVLPVNCGRDGKLEIHLAPVKVGA
jgi:hypothetical protein